MLWLEQHKHSHKLQLLRQRRAVERQEPSRRWSEICLMNLQKIRPSKKEKVVNADRQASFERSEHIRAKISDIRTDPGNYTFGSSSRPGELALVRTLLTLLSPERR